MAWMIRDQKLPAILLTLLIMSLVINKVGDTQRPHSASDEFVVTQSQNAMKWNTYFWCWPLALLQICHSSEIRECQTSCLASIITSLFASKVGDSKSLLNQGWIPVVTVSPSLMIWLSILILIASSCRFACCGDQNLPAVLPYIAHHISVAKWDRRHSSPLFHKLFRW